MKIASCPLFFLSMTFFGQLLKREKVYHSFRSSSAWHMVVTYFQQKNDSNYPEWTSQEEAEIGRDEIVMPNFAKRTLPQSDIAAAEFCALSACAVRECSFEFFFVFFRSR
jgi:hypothetical protein